MPHSPTRAVTSPWVTNVVLIVGIAALPATVAFSSFGVQLPAIAYYGATGLGLSSLHGVSRRPILAGIAKVLAAWRGNAEYKK